MQPKGCGEANKVQIVSKKKNVNFNELKKRRFECFHFYRGISLTLKKKEL